jgi:hypothetical protein|tara:strand:+ start:864 stop:1217 length:354 start_codon:yes stop_codon:yes gene_type:complete
MAYVSQDDKKKLAPAIKAVLKKYKVKASIAVRNHSTLVVNLKKGEVDFGDAFYQVNTYWIDEHFENKPVAKSFLNELLDAMKGVDYFNDDDSQTDYFSRSHYTDINIGGWKTSYELI